MTIFSPEVPEDELVAAIEHVGNLVVNAGGTITQINREAPWGRRRLAYPVRYGGHDVRDGIYVLYFIDLPADKVVEVERDLKLTVTLMRFLVSHQVQEPQPLPSELAAEEQAAEEAAAAMAEAARPQVEPSETEPAAVEAAATEVAADGDALEASEPDAVAVADEPATAEPVVAETAADEPETVETAELAPESLEPEIAEAPAAEGATETDEPTETETAEDAGTDSGEEG